MTGCRRLWSLIDGLPQEASVWTPDTKNWSQADELMAQQVEVLDAWSRVIYTTLYAAHSNGKTPKLPPPLEIEHPGRQVSKPRKQVETDPDRIKQFFSNI